MTCPVSEHRHSWWKCGLDIHRGRLIRLRRCVWCGATKRERYP